jgi:hypothetical protein
MKTLPIAAALTAVVVTVPAAAQLNVQTGRYELTMSGRVQTQFRTSSAPSARSSEFLLRRARVTVVVRAGDFIEAKIQPDFAGFAMKDAYVRLNFDPTFTLTLGNAKRPFDLFELYSSTQIIVIERTGKIDGVADCAGVGGVCSWSQLTEKLAFSDRDVGVFVDGASGRVDYHASVTNGSGTIGGDDNGALSYTGRARFQAAQNLRVALNIAAHDYAHPDRLNDEYAVAFGGDVEWGAYGDDGAHIQAGFLLGQNWRNLDAAGDPSTFTTAQTVMGYRLPLANPGHFTAVEPLARVSWADPDKDATVGSGGWLVTPGVAFHLSGRNMMVANVDVWLPEEGDREWSLKLQSMLYF